MIMATNRQDTLDPALLRPGRLDREIEFTLPSRRERWLIFQTVISKMNLTQDVDLEDCEKRALICLLYSDALVISFRRFTTRPFIFRRNFFSRSSCRFTGYSAKRSFPSHLLTKICSCSQKSLCYPSHRL